MPPDPVWDRRWRPRLHTAHIVIYATGCIVRTSKARAGVDFSRKKGIEPLPSSLHDAVNEMEGSELLADTLGDHVFEWFIRNKREEWDAYQAQVTQFELDRYLPLL